MNIDLKEGDYAYIEWNGTQYVKKTHYHIVEVTDKIVKVRVPGSYIYHEIPIKDIKVYRVIQLKGDI